MKRILLSVLTIGVVAVVAVFATSAFFSDEEVSNNNTFVAGSLDLQIDSEQHYNGNVCELVNQTYQWVGQAPFPVAGTPCDGTWPEKDLVAEKFFNFTDVKPGDYGENTISIHANSNDQYVCAAIYNMESLENDNLPAEQTDGDNTTPAGELADQLNFFAWADTNGNNVWEDGELPLFTNTYGPASDVLNGKVYPLYTPATGGDLNENATGYVGLYWCFGTLTADTTNETLTCNGASVNNTAQTDSLVADMAFYAVQSRNNEQFACPDISTFQVPQAAL